MFDRYTNLYNPTTDFENLTSFVSYIENERKNVLFNELEEENAIEWTARSLH